MQPKVSMVVPVYNKIEYIDATLESIRNQVWDHLQLILVNDGATDGTREKLEEWRPRLETRGYEVIIIDQENQGICAAVLHGMQHMDGEYFCCIDCDDLLNAEYLSTMAAFLEQNNRYDWACCDFLERYGTDIRPGPPRKALPTNPNFLENFLLRRVVPVSWIYLFRVSFIKRCRVMENFITSPRGCQEQSLIIPVAAAKGRGYYIDKPLYIYVRDGRDDLHTSLKQLSLIDPNFLENQGIHAQLAIDKLDIPPKEKKRLTEIQTLGIGILLAKYKYSEYKTFGLPSNAYRLALKELARSANQIFSLKSPLDEDTLFKTGLDVFETAVANAFLGTTPSFVPTASARIIGYGALGQAAAKRAGLFMEKVAPIDELWDMRAGSGEVLNGIPVEKPHFPSLKKGDLVLVFPHSGDILAQVRQDVGKSGAHIIAQDAIIEYLAKAYYPF